MKTQKAICSFFQYRYVTCHTTWLQFVCTIKVNKSTTNFNDNVFALFPSIWCWCSKVGLNEWTEEKKLNVYICHAIKCTTSLLSYLPNWWLQKNGDDVTRLNWKYGLMRSGQFRLFDFISSIFFFLLSFFSYISVWIEVLFHRVNALVIQLTSTHLLW